MFVVFIFFFYIFFVFLCFFFFSSRRRHTRFDCDWSSDVCSSDLGAGGGGGLRRERDRLRARGVPGGRRRGRRHHHGGVPALDRPRHRGQGGHRAVRGPRRGDGGDAERVAPRSEERRVGKEGRSRR